MAILGWRKSTRPKRPRLLGSSRPQTGGPYVRGQFPGPAPAPCRVWGANDWEVVNVPGGRVSIRSLSKGHQGWLDAVINGDAAAWRSPPPEDHEHKKRRLAMEAESKVLADAEAALAAQATLDSRLPRPTTSAKRLQPKCQTQRLGSMATSAKFKLPCRPGMPHWLRPCLPSRWLRGNPKPRT